MEPAFDSAPPHLLDAAKAAFKGRTSAELAALVYDSLLDANAPPEDHVLRFESERFSLEIEVSARSTEVELAGGVAPPQGGRIELVIDEGEVSFSCNSPDGSFAFGPVGHGMARLFFTPTQGSAVHTDRFRL